MNVGRVKEMAGPQTGPFGPSSSSSAESRITAFVSDLVRTEPIEEAFNLFLVHNKNADDDLADKCSRWNALIAEVQTDSNAGSNSSSAIENALTGKSELSYLYFQLYQRQYGL